MDLEKYIEAIFKKLDKPFFVINLASYEILGLNIPMAVILDEIMKNSNKVPSNYTFNEYSRISDIDNDLTIIVYIATKVKRQHHIARINKNTIDQLFKSKQHDKLVENTVALLNQFDNIDVLASGVETKEQAEFMRKCGASMASGNLYSQEEFVKKFFNN